MAWNLFITSGAIPDIETYNNTKIHSIMNNSSNTGNANIPTQIKVFDYIDMKSLFWIALSKRLVWKNINCYKRLFVEGFGHPVLGAVTSVKRFEVSYMQP